LVETPEFAMPGHQRKALIRLQEISTSLPPKCPPPMPPSPIAEDVITES
jgi:hypothetical protein